MSVVHGGWWSVLPLGGIARTCPRTLSGTAADVEEGHDPNLLAKFDTSWWTTSSGPADEIYLQASESEAFERTQL